MPIASIKELVEAGVHFGHRASRWNPKMAPYIFGKRNLIHIVDLKETIKGLIRSTRFLARVAARAEDILFVGTKRQARVSVEAQARRCGMPYVTERWLGGTLTNFRTITSRVKRLEDLEELEKSGRIQLHSKKMIASLQREMRKMLRNLEGIRNMRRLPGVLVVVDPHHEKIAVAEARKLGIPTVCLTDTDSDPDVVDILTPGNDDAIRAITLYVKKMADAVLDGKKQTPKARPAKTEGGVAEEPKAKPAEESAEQGDRGRRGRRGPPRRAGGAGRSTQRLPGGKVVAAERPPSSHRDGRGGRGGERRPGYGQRRPEEAAAPEAAAPQAKAPESPPPKANTESAPAPKAVAPQAKAPESPPPKAKTESVPAPKAAAPQAKAPESPPPKANTESAPAAEPNVEKTGA